MEAKSASKEQRREYVLSRHIGIMPIGPAHIIATHVLGRWRIIGGTRVMAELAQFETATAVEPHEDSAEFLALRRGLLVKRVDTDEEAWVRSAYARAAALADTNPVPALLLAAEEADDAACSAANSLVGMRLVASNHLATIAIGNREHVVTHPSGSPTHLAPDLWDLFERFRVGRAVAREERHAAHFLRSRGLLWPDTIAERDACLKAHGLVFDQMPDCAIITRANDLFRQIHRPYTVAHVDRRTRPKRVALIGPCLSQQFAECLEYHAFSLGWSIETVGMLEPERQLAGIEFDLVVLNAAQFVAYLVQYAGQERWDDCELLVDRIVDAVVSRVRETRDLTAAPIAVAAVHPPALGVFVPGSRETYRLEAMFARINLMLADRFDAREGIYMLDEIDAREQLQSGLYWDDRYNAAAHRAPMSGWNWAVLKPDHSDGRRPNDMDHDVPPARPDQSDPAGPMTLAILELMARLSPRSPVDTVIFEPRGLLWPPRPKPVDLDRAAHRNFQVDVEDYWFAGVAEALAAIARRGVRLVCLTDADPDDLARGIAVAADTDTFLGREHISEVHCTGDKDAVIDRLLARRAAQNPMLWIDFTRNESRPRQGLIVFPLSSRWQLREQLLRAPELAKPLPLNTTVENLADRAPANITAEVTRQCVRDAIRRSLMAETNCPAEELEDVEHFADLGLNSLSIMRVILGTEKMLGCRIESWDRISTRLWEVGALEQVLVAALTAAQTREAADES